MITDHNIGLLLFSENVHLSPSQLAINTVMLSLKYEDVCLGLTANA